MLWKAALSRRISRMVFKCRLSLTSPVRSTRSTSTSQHHHHAGLKGANNNGLLTVASKRSASAVRADNAYILAVFFVFFLLVMIVTQVMVMRSEFSASLAGKSHPRSFRPAPLSSLSSSSLSSSSSSSTNSRLRSNYQKQQSQQQPQQDGLGRPFRFGRQPAPFGRVLAADRHTGTTGGSGGGGGGGDTNAAAGPASLADDGMINDNPLTAGEWLGRLPQQQGRDAWVDQLWLCYQKGRSVCPWQPVAGRDKCFVYSAYLDDSTAGPSNGGVVRVIGVAKTKKPEKLWCQLGRTVSENGTAAWISVQAQIKTIREHWNLRYSAVFILCPIPKNPVAGLAFRPEFVSISTSQNPVMIHQDLPTKPTASRAEFNASYGHWSSSVTANLLPVIRSSSYDDEHTTMRHEDVQAKHQLTVCVKPLHYSFNRANQLIEFIEMHRLLGASHFTFYNHTVGPEVDCVLRRYIETGLVDVLPWHQLDIVSQKEIRTEGIFASLNDCLYRHMFDSQYLLMIDLDELVVPRSQFTLTDMITSTVVNGSTGVSGANGRHYRIGAYYFRNAFFYLSWPDDAAVHSDWFDGDRTDLMISLRKTRRNVKLHPHRIRSKYICRPTAVVEVGNHFVWEFRAGHVAAHVPDSLAVMHHYRTCEFGGETCLANPSVQDRSAWKYGDSLVSAVRQRFQQFAPRCPSLAASSSRKNDLPNQLASNASDPIVAATNIAIPTLSTS